MPQGNVAIELAEPVTQDAVLVLTRTGSRNRRNKSPARRSRPETGRAQIAPRRRTASRRRQRVPPQDDTRPCPAAGGIGGLTGRFVMRPRGRSRRSENVGYLSENRRGGR